MIFGVSRHQYEAPARFKVGGPVQRIRYFFAPEGAQVYLEPNVFFPLEQTLQYTPTEGVGELCTEKRNHDKRKKPAGVEGDMVHGTADDFLGLTPYNGPVPIADVPNCRVPKMIRFFCHGPAKRLLSSTFALQAVATMPPPPRPTLTLTCSRPPAPARAPSIVLKAMKATKPPSALIALSAGKTSDETAKRSSVKLSCETSVESPSPRIVLSAVVENLTITHPDDGPGTTCVDALELPVGTDYTYTTSTTDAQWYRFPVSSGTLYHLRLDPVFSPWVISPVYTGVDCAHATFEAFLDFSNQCFDATPSVDGFFFFAVQATATPVSYTFHFDTGAC